MNLEFIKLRLEKILCDWVKRECIWWLAIGLCIATQLLTLFNTSFIKVIFGDGIIESMAPGDSHNLGNLLKLINQSTGSR